MLPPELHELGTAWLTLSSEEQRRREADFLGALQAFARGDSDVAVELVDHEGVLGVWMHRWKAPALERKLLDHVLDEARRRSEAASEPSPSQRRREVDRTLRAHVLVAWERYAFRGFVVAIALAGLVGLHPWGGRSIGAVALRLAVAVVVLIVLGRLVERWYRRSAHEPE